MTFVSLADACRQLGIDPKTLRRWLALAHLYLQPHPSDGRKHGLSQDHLLLLARLHQRRLAGLPEEWPVPVPAEQPPWPADLLMMPETLASLQAQIATLQQQVATLTRLLQPTALQPARPAAPAPQTRASKQSATQAPPPPRARRAASATPPRKPVHVIPRVEYGHEGRYVVICPKHGLLSLEPDTPEWFAWLATQSSFRFVGQHGTLTAHHEWRIPKGAWRAHRQIRNHSYTLPLAPTQALTMAVLEQAAEVLQAHLM